MKSILTSLIFLSVIVTVHPSPTADAGSNHTICLGESVTLGDGLGMGYTYEWSPAQDLDNPFTHHPVASPSITTTYTLTVTNDHGCSATDDVIVSVTPLPTAGFSLSPTCMVINTDITFTNLSGDATDYHWDFGNGSVSEEENPTHQFSEYGYYCITLIVSNACGSDTIHETIFIQPALCVCEGIYDVPDGTIIDNSITWDPAFWGGANVITVEGDIIVNQDVQFKIEDMTLRFAPKGRIIVKGLLIIINSTLTNLEEPCNYMWQGIEVPGLISLQNTNIYNAHIGVLLGTRNIDYICNHNLDKFDISPSGGAISSGNSNFINNGIDIKFFNYNINNNQLFYGCHFICHSSLRDLNYNSTTGTSPYPNDQNPWAGYANVYQRTDVGIYIEGQKGLYNFINECTFENKQYCIKSFDSKYNVYNSEFKQAIYGIKIVNVVSSVDNNHEIVSCTFDEIPGETGIAESAAINIMGGGFDNKHHNKFINSTLDVNCSNVGMQLDFTSGYQINENTFERYKKAIIANWNVSGWIGASSPLWDGNQFHRCERAIETNYDNTDLTLKCNDHYPDQYQSLYDVNWNNFGIYINFISPFPPYTHIFIDWTLGDQGWDCLSPNCPAGNTFNNQLIKEIESNTYYEYRHHGDDNDFTNKYRPITNTGVNRIATYIDYTTNAQSCSPVINPVIPLPDFSFNVQPYSELDSLNNIKDNLQNELDNLISNLDKGETQILLNAVIGNTPNGKLKNMLTGHSPLSDTVIYTLMNEHALSPGNFKLVMYKNLPVSRIIALDFYDYIKNLPKGIRNQLKQLQINNPNAVTPASIRKKIAQTQRTYTQLLDGIIVLLLDTNHNRKADAIQLLEYDGSVRSKQILYGTYLADGDYSNAAAKLNELSAEQYPMIDDFVELHQILLSLYQQGKTIYDIDSIDFAYVHNLAYKCPPNPAVYNARAIVDILLGEYIPLCPKFIDTKSMQISNNDGYSNEVKIDNHILGDNYPEPFTESTKIPYLIPDGTAGKIVVRNVLGKIIKVIDVESGNNVVELKAADWAKGIYYYNLEVNGINIDYKKMLRIK